MIPLMAGPARFYQTTAIDYPNSRPHIGTAFEKIGAEELGQTPQAYCDDMARQFREVWGALEISYDTFIQTSHERHKQCCRKFIQKVYDNGHIYKGEYGGWYCDGCEEFKTDKQHAEHNGL